MTQGTWNVIQNKTMNNTCVMCFKVRILDLSEVKCMF